MSESILAQSQKAKRGVFGFIFSKKFIIIVGLAIILGGGAYYFFYYRAADNATATVQIKKWTAKKEDLKIAVEATGKVVAKDGVELSFPVTGNLEVDNVYVKEGDKVKKGDKIASVKTESLEFELRNAYSSYQSALANFNTKQESATESEINKAKIAIEQAQVSLDQAKISLEQTKSSSNQSIANAESNLQTAKNNLQLNSSVTDSENVRNAYASLVTTLKSIDLTLQRTLRDSDSIIGVDDTLINIDFKEGLGAKDATSFEEAKSSYRSAKEARANFSAQLSALTGNDNAASDAAAAAVGQALIVFQDHLSDMQKLLDATMTFANLSQSKLDGFKSTISSDRSSVNSSIASLNSAQQAVASAKNNLSQYQIAYDKAVNDLSTAQKQAEQNINNANISIRSREIALTSAQNDYKDLIAPVKESDLASARAQLTSAAISVDKAKYNMEQATLISPIDGVIAMLNYKQGDIILSDSAKTMATIINNDTLFIEANIEEADVSKLKVGDQAVVTFDAIDGLSLRGEISFISLTSTTSTNGIVTYLVRVILNNDGKAQIREGMTAAIEFVTAEALGVLSVPVAAVRNINGHPAVELADGSIAQVTTGFTDGKKVEVISGLSEGNVIIY
ncbi:MAG: efflux RND transporter periplasmic adaptor subunit [Patescibacteria group bacterium]